MEDEKENITVTVDIEAKSDNFGLIKPHNEKEIKRDRPIQPHNGKEIYHIIVSQHMKDDPYVVTYSKEDNSIRGWLVNIEEDGQQTLDVYFKLDQNYRIEEFVLYKKILVFDYHGNGGFCKYLF